MLFLGIYGATMTLISSNTQKTQERIEQVSNFFDDLAKSYFVSYKITDEKNEFYIDEQLWFSASLDEKMKLHKLAAGIAADEKNSKIPSEDYSKRTSHHDEMNKTKIYGSKSRQLIAEYYLDESHLDKDIVNLTKEIMKAYKFYKIKK